MAYNDPLNRANFGLLPEPQGRLGSFGVSTVINLVIASLLILFTMAKMHEQVRHYDTTQLVFPVEQPKPYIAPVPRVTVVAPPQPATIPAPPKIVMPRVVPEQARPEVVRLSAPPMPAMPPAPPKSVSPPPQPKVGLFKSAAPTLVANNQVKPTPKTGGFGDPMGVTPNPNATRPANIAAVGTFDAAPGVGSGAGAARQGSVKGTAFGSGVANGVPGGTSRGTIASAGFSNGVVGGSPGGTGRGTGTVATGNFGTKLATMAAPTMTRAVEPTTTPMIIVEKPRPQYTSEARQLRIEGDVTLKVRFTAAGQIQVLGVMNGLGHGLDEQAEHAVERIHYKPATQNGQPVDQVSVIHVTFQLA
jgi:TonB family protein